MSIAKLLVPPHWGFLAKSYLPKPDVTGLWHWQTPQQSIHKHTLWSGAGQDKQLRVLGIWYERHVHRVYRLLTEWCITDTPQPRFAASVYRHTSGVAKWRDCPICMLRSDDYQNVAVPKNWEIFSIGVSIPQPGKRIVGIVCFVLLQGLDGEEKTRGLIEQTKLLQGELGH